MTKLYCDLCGNDQFVSGQVVVLKLGDERSFDLCEKCRDLVLDILIPMPWPRAESVQRLRELAMKTGLLEAPENGGTLLSEQTRNTVKTS